MADGADRRPVGGPRAAGRAMPAARQGAAIQSPADHERDPVAAREWRQMATDTTNAEPNPFRWVKTADDILASVKRFCLQALGASTMEEALARTSESGH